MLELPVAEELAELVPRALVAFPGGRGTKDMKDKARAAGMQMVVIE